MASNILKFGAAVAVLALAAFIAFGLQSQGIQFRTVVSGSMSPAINVGDVVAIARVNASDLKIGDIITFGSAGTYTTHRIINVTPDGFLTKGDANEDPDMEVTRPGSVEGIVIFCIPYLGHLGNFVRTPMGFALFIFIPGLLIILNELAKIKKEVKGKKHKVPRLEYRHYEKNPIKADIEPKPEPLQKTVHKNFGQYESIREELEKKERQKHGQD
ncbi:MAG: signal peptidase I [Candidatus Aenigmarchaeota archaeon]|nr:signal peptidase I [Candidatus Aenigmarchaeota archaeon]